MNMQYAKMFHKALEVLSEATTEMQVAMDNELSESPDSGDCLSKVEAFDEALQIVLAARNDFCQEDELPIENGEISWKLSQAMKDAEAAERELA